MVDLVFKLIAALATVTSLGLSVTALRHSRRQESQHDSEDIIEKLTTVCADVLVLKKQMEIFWKGVGFSAAQAIHSPHTPELDRLLEMFQSDDIHNAADWRRLKQLLRSVASDEDANRAKWASDLLVLIEVREVGENMAAELAQAAAATANRSRAKGAILGLLK